MRNVSQVHLFVLIKHVKFVKELIKLVVPFGLSLSIKKYSKKKQLISESLQNAMKAMEEIYDKIIVKIYEQKQLLKDQREYYGLRKQQVDFVKILLQGKKQYIKGSLISNALLSLPKVEKFVNNQQAVRKAWSCKQKQFDIFLEYFRKVHFKAPITIQSKIINSTQVITSFFDQPILQYQLLFRASQNNFSIYTFHKKCDGKKNTLLLARSEHGKIIGGFTPLQWTSQDTYTYENGKEYQLKHFYFLQHKNHQTAIYGSSNQGPTFGGGHDLYISSQSNISNASYTNFGNSYSTGKKMLSNQQAYEFFTGAKAGYSVRFTQWQVYQLEL